MGSVKKVFCGLLGPVLNTVLPDDCRLCSQPLRNFSRIPVCDACLKLHEPLVTEFYCMACRMPFLNRFPLDESGRCTLCRLGIRGFDAAYSYGSYEGPLRELVHLFKYSGVEPLAENFADWLAVVLPRDQQFDVIVPMPLHWLKRLQRGFNQSELLAKQISRRWNVPMRSVIRRKKATAPQAGLTNSKRRLNVQGAFAIRSRVRLEGQRVLLIDDVLTTGSTAAACARVLKRAGAKHVTVLTLARTDRRMAVEELRFPKSAATAAGSSSI